MATIEFTVLRDHWGDSEDGKGRRRYVKGDKRLADPAAVQVELQRKILAEPVAAKVDSVKPEKPAV